MNNLEENFKNWVLLDNRHKELNEEVFDLVEEISEKHREILGDKIKYGEQKEE